MCGICGVVSKDNLPNEYEYIVKKMMDSLQHRGPNGEGFFCSGNLIMGMRRLSIIDLEGGWQPIYNEDHSLILIVNGEIYNYIELRNKLLSLGHRFYTEGDCETIIHLYEEYGMDALQYLRGMFVFALWDSRQKKLVLARDRMGEKPLYLYEKNGSLLFASEMKALLKSGLIPFELDPRSVNLFFHYTYVPEPMTILKDVRKLDAATYIIFDTETGSREEKIYWRMEDSEPIEGDPAKIIRQELEKISEIIIRSDVPVGVSLSGGIDSSLIASLTSRSYPGTMHAFSVGYRGNHTVDERSIAEDLSTRLKIPFHNIEISTHDVIELFPNLDIYRDDPIADISGFGYYAVMKAAHDNQIPVLLQGHGGDELFWYSWVVKSLEYTSLKQNLVEKGMGGFLREVLKKPQNQDYKGWIKNGFGLADGAGKYQLITQSPKEQMIFWELSPKFPNAKANINKFYGKRLKEILLDVNPSSHYTHDHPWPYLPTHFTRMICDTYLRENGIAQGDRLSMASSVELRLPLVDYRLVETVIGLRKNYQDDKLEPKKWLKDAVKDLLPSQWFTFQKRGFSPPTHEWLSALFDNYINILKDGYLMENGFYDPGIVNHFNSISSNGLWESQFYEALVLENWCRKMQLL